MAEEKKVEQSENSKTLVSFVVGLLIGGMLVWAFSGGDDHDQDHSDDAEVIVVDEETVVLEEDMSTTDVETDPVDEMQSLPVGDGSISVSDQPAGLSVALDSATYPIEEGWIGVRDYNNGQLSFIKGVVRFSAAAGLVPETIALQAPTVAGEEYAIVVFSDNGDNSFNTAGDVQIDEIFATFVAE